MLGGLVEHNHLDGLRPPMLFSTKTEEASMHYDFYIGVESATSTRAGERRS